MTSYDFLCLSPQARAEWIFDASDAEVKALRHAMATGTPGLVLSEHPAFHDAQTEANARLAREAHAAAERARAAHLAEHHARKRGERE